MTTEKRILFTGKEQASLEEFARPSVGSEEVGVRTLHTLMSTGTENIVFRRMFEAGSHWDNWVKYPFHPGYSSVGVVEEVGSGVTSLAVGDVVVSRSRHASYQVLPVSEVGPVPSGVDPKQAAWFALAKICAMGARAAQYVMGDSALIIGAGPIGQMSIRWAFSLGVENIIVVDPMKSRIPFAKAGGATLVFDQPVDACFDQIQAATDGKGARVVVDSTGNAAVFTSALKAVQRKGKVVVLGDTGAPTTQHLTSDVITRGLTIVGAHDGLSEGDADALSIYRLFFALVKSGRFNLEGLITHEFAPEQYQEAYGVANTKREETMGILFNWS